MFLNNILWCIDPYDKLDYKNGFPNRCQTSIAHSDRVRTSNQLGPQILALDFLSLHIRNRALQCIREIDMEQRPI